MIAIVRGQNSGVTVGEVVSMEPGRVVLKNARRIWRWRGLRGAKTLTGLAMHGSHMTEYTRIDAPAPSSTIMEPQLEVIECSAVGAENLMVSRWF